NKARWCVRRDAVAERAVDSPIVDPERERRTDCNGRRHSDHEDFWRPLSRAALSRCARRGGCGDTHEAESYPAEHSEDRIAHLGRSETGNPVGGPDPEL